MTYHNPPQDWSSDLLLPLLDLTASSTKLADLLSGVCGLVQDRTGVEAVAIRLRRENDFPYTEWRGFPAEFIEAESRLCSQDSSGEPICDHQGDPVLRCLCGDVLCKRFDPSRPCFTPGGSFWTNSLAPAADAAADDGNRCHREGYQSMALIPLRAGSQVFGLLQCNDRREGRFSPAAISILERLADALAVAVGFFDACGTVRKVYSELDERVHRRTAALRHSNKKLRAEVQQRRRAEARLRKSEERFRRLVEASPHGIIECTLDGTITFSAPASDRLLGYTAGELIGMKAWEVIHPEETQIQVREMLRRRPAARRCPALGRAGIAPRTAASSPSISTGAGNWTTTAGRPATWSSSPTCRSSGGRRNPCRAERLASIGTLAAGIAHEINNPLGAIALYASVAMKVKDHAERRAMLDDALHQIEAQTLRCGQIVKSVLQFARQEELHRWRVDLGRIARRARDLERKLANQRRVFVMISPPATPVELTANPLEMEQVLVNLVRNAIQASAAGGWVAVRLEPEPETIRLTVADNGCGMNETQIARIFDPFYSTRQEQGGMGLGLSIVYGIVKRQGGDIDIRSSPGQGTTVTVLLPRNLSPSERRTKMTKVLIVDDDAAYRDSLQSLLGLHGLEAAVAATGDEALKTAAMFKPDVLVIDWLLSNHVDGFDVIQALRASGLTSPVILISGYPSPPLKAHLESLPDVQFLTKPFPPKVLLAAIETAMQGK